MADSRKRSADRDEENEQGDEAVRKRTCVKTSEDPDVTIVVGGVEYYEYRQVLRCLSGYFDAAFKSGMKEAQASRFEFPDKDPKDWETVMAVLLPGSRARATVDNIDLVLTWCDELCIMNPPAHCDFIYKKRILKAVPPLQSIRDGDLLDKPRKIVEDLIGTNQFLILDFLEKSLRFQLDTTTALLFESLTFFLMHIPGVFTIRWVERVVEMVKAEPECKKNLWPSLKNSLSISVKNKPAEELLNMELFPHLLHSQLARRGIHRFIVELDRTTFAAVRAGNGGREATPQDRAFYYQWDELLRKSGRRISGKLFLKAL